MGTPHGRRIAAKHLCFFEIVKAEFQAREARLSNAEMQKRMRSKLDTSKVNGYQVAGDAMKKFALDINAILPNCFLFEHLNDRVIQVRWR
jgi:glycine/serine hydroxymethyltransferase